MSDWAARSPRRTTCFMAGAPAIMSAKPSLFDAFLDRALHFAGQVLDLQGIADRDRDPFRAGRLDEKVDRPGPHGRDHRLDPAGRGQHDDRKVDLLALQGLEGLHPVHAGHDQIQQHDIDTRGGHAIEGRLAAFRGLGPIALLLDYRLQQAALCRVVIDDQYRFHHLTHAFSVALFFAGPLASLPVLGRTLIRTVMGQSSKFHV